MPKYNLLLNFEVSPVSAKYLYIESVSQLFRKIAASDSLHINQEKRSDIYFFENTMFPRYRKFIFYLQLNLYKINFCNI